MSPQQPSLEALRIDRGTPPPRRHWLPLWPSLAAAILLLGGGAAAWHFWPQPSVTVRAVTADARGDAAAGGGLDATGYVVARRIATISARIQGRLTDLNVEEGQRIEKGAVVARLEDSTYAAVLAQSRAQAAQARIAYDDARPITERYERLITQGAISADTLERQRAVSNAARAAVGVTEAAVRLAQVNLGDTIVRAPFSGIVVARPAQVGEIVAPASAGGGFTRTGIATIVDMDTLEVEVDVSENYIDRVKPGGVATIVLDAYSDWEIPAAVIAIIPTADRSKGTVKVRVAIKQRDPRILPDMGARVAFVTTPGVAGPPPRGVTVSRDAVKDNGRGGIVFVIGPQNRLEQRDVTLGARRQQSIVLLTGVTAGERLVSGDLNRLHDGQTVTVEE